MTILNNLPLVRYYTALDPYYYTVDNRPIVDLRNNIEGVAEGADASIHSAKSTATALGFIARGYAMRAGIESEMMVGKNSITDLVWSIDHSFLLQQVTISGTDARVVPKVGLSIDLESFPLTASAVVAEHQMYTVDARITPADVTSPFYDPANTSYADLEPFEVGNVEYVLTDEGSFAASTPPTPVAAGYTRLAVVRVPEGSLVLTEGMTTFVNFKEDGAAFGGNGSFSGDYELNIDARTIGGSGPGDANITVDTVAGTTLIDSLTIDPDFAMVYVNGVYQTGYQIIVPDSILLPVALTTGTKLAFVSTAGGTYTGGKYEEQKIDAVAGQSFFNNLEVRPDFSTLYIDGVYQGRDTYAITGSDQITLNVALPSAATLFLVERSAGLADIEHNVPFGGAINEVLTKLSAADYDYAWVPPTPGSGASLPAADPVTDVGRVLTYAGLDGSLEPTYIWATVSNGGFGAGAFLHQDLVISTPTTSVVATQDPSKAMIFVGGAFQGKAGRDFDVIGNVIEFYHVLPQGTVVDIVFTGSGGGVDQALLESSVLALVNSQESYSKPQMIVNNTCNLGGGNYMVGNYVSGEIAISTDYGRTWTNSTPANLPTGIGGIATNGLGMIVAVGDGNVKSYSTDGGATWTQGVSAPAVPNSFANTVHYYAATGTWVAGGTLGLISTSTDGINWVPNQIHSDLDILDIAVVANGGSGEWVAVGVDGQAPTINHIWQSVDPAGNWFPTTDGDINPLVTGGYVKVISNGTTWVAAQEDGRIAYTVNPSVPTGWTHTYEMVGSPVCRGIGYFDSVFVVFGDNNIAAVSMDLGSTWDEYIIGNGNSNEVYTTMLADGTSGLILGAYDTARTFSKMRRA